MNKHRIKTTIFSLFLIFPFLFSPFPSFAQEELLITSHTIIVNQDVEGEISRYGITEEVTVENKSAKSYEGQLTFFVDPAAEGITITALKNDEEQPRVPLETSSPEEELVTADLTKETFIEAQGALNLELVYSFTSSEENKSIWRKKIVTQHKPESLQIKINPQEGAGYFPQSNGFETTREQGWFNSPMLSPQIEDVYSLAIVKKGEEVAFSKKEELIDIPLLRLNKAISDNLMTTFLVNNFLILFLVVLLPRLIKKTRLSKPRIKLPKIRVKITVGKE